MYKLKKRSNIYNKLNNNHKGLATADFLLAIDFLISPAGTLAGSLRVDGSIEIQPTEQGRRVAGHATIKRLKLSERGGNRLGISPNF